MVLALDFIERSSIDAHHAREVECEHRCGSSIV
jgi:hypothetical protein